MNGITAIARLTVVESLRKRVFLGLVAFGVAFIMMAALLRSVGAAERVIQLQAWACRLIFFFSALVAIALASASLPEDAETRRLQILLSKPVRRTEVVLGKYMGLLGIMAVYLALMGLICMALVRIMGTLSGPVAERSLSPAGVWQASDFQAGPGATPKTYGSSPGVHQLVGGPLDRHLAWRFDGVTRARFGETVNGRVRLRAGLSNPDAFTLGDAQAVRLKIVNPARPPVPDGVSALSLRVWTRRWESFSFPVSEAEPGGTVWIRLNRVDARAWTAGHVASMELHALAGALAFEANFTKALGLIFIQLGIALSLTLAVSLLASTLVTMLAGLSFLFFCTMAGFFQETLRVSMLMLEEMKRTVPHTHANAPPDFPPWLIDIANRVTAIILWFFPDFSRLDYSGFLISNLSMPVTSLAGPADLLRYATFLVVPLLAACAIASRKEFT